MNYQEFKKLLRWEFKLKTGEYLTFHIGEETITKKITEGGKQITTSIFDIDFPTHFQTYFFCNRTVKVGSPFFVIEKIITINFDGEIFMFTTFDDFINYVKRLDYVELIQPYTIGGSNSNNG